MRPGTGPRPPIREDAFFQMRNQSYAVDWSGAGGDALRERTSADLLIVSAKADMLREAAGIARNGSGDISAAQRRVLYGVEDAHNAGFTVGEDLSVTDTHTSSTPAEQAARQAQAQAFAGDIRLRAQQLDEADAKVAGQLTAATADLGSVDFAQSPIPNPVAQAPATHRKGVQLVDFKQDGGISPRPHSHRWTLLMEHRRHLSPHSFRSMSRPSRRRERRQRRARRCLAMWAIRRE